MRFLDRETCETLAKLGCVSESNFCYILSSDENQWDLYYLKPKLHSGELPKGCIPVFNMADFVENLPYAIENCKKLLVWRANLIGCDWREAIKEACALILAHKKS